MPPRRNHSSPPAPIVRAVRSLLALGAVAAATYGRAEPPQPSSVQVDVSGFRNEKGSLVCGLYANEDAFPDGSGVRRTAPISGRTATCTFPGVAPGTYAVAVFHDENGNGKLDKSFFGAPKEGYGASNNHTRALSAPKWGESSFAIAAGERKVLAVSLRY